MVLKHRYLLGQLLSFVRQPGLGRVWVVLYYFHFLMIELTHCVLGNFQKNSRNRFIPLPRFIPPHDSISEFYGQFFGLPGGVSALTFTVNCGTLYKKVCFFLNHIQSIELATGGLQVVRTSQRWSKENGCTWAQYGTSLQRSSHSSIQRWSGDPSRIVPNSQGDCFRSTNALYRVWSQWMDCKGVEYILTEDISAFHFLFM